MIDRMFLWEMSQVRRHELLELAAVMRPQRGFPSLAPIFKTTKAGARLITQAWSRAVASDPDAARPATSLR